MANGCCDGEREGCCQPKDILTIEEESVLEKMRELRLQALVVTEKIIGIKKDFKRVFGDPEETFELKELQSKLDFLREQWAEWERKLDYATEKKLIDLGHKPPDPNRFT